MRTILASDVLDNWAGEIVDKFHEVMMPAEYVADLHLIVYFSAPAGQHCMQKAENPSRTQIEPQSSMVFSSPHCNRRPRAEYVCHSLYVILLLLWSNILVGECPFPD